MCGIIGYFNQKDTSIKLKEGLELISSRGKDGCGYYNGKVLEVANSIDELNIEESNNLIGHVLHSIVSHVKQPLKKKGSLVINCEIYNWKELCEKYSLNSSNDSELVLDLLDKQGVMKTLAELDGVYAFAYWNENKVYLARDILGIKPLWYSLNEFSFCSEKKGMEEELNPREVLIYSVNKKKIERKKRKFFEILPEWKSSKEELDKKLKSLLVNSLEKRIPKVKMGVLFSGGIDSTLISWLLKQKNVDFTCYTAVLDHSDFKEPEDLIYSKKVSKELGFKLKIAKIKLVSVEKYIKQVISLIEDTNVVKVGVGITILAAAELARKDGIKVLFSGLGSEEIFAGYERHTKTKEVNKECVSGLLKLYERDTYRDDVITMNQNIELRLPFLDKELVSYSLKIPAKYKLNGRSKAILRDVAKQLGINEEFAERKKKAAQYGSKFDRAIQKLTRNAGLKRKSEYLGRFLKKPNLKLGALFSGGKDSVFSAYTMMKQNYEITCLITMKSKNPDSYMFHTPNIHLVDLQAEAMDIPLATGYTEGEKEKELEDLEKTIKKAKEKFKIEGIVTGALFSDYQRKRIERICDKLNLKIFSPLWHMNQEKEMRLVIKEFEIIMSSVAAEGLDKTWLGRKITEEDVDKLVKLNKKIGLNIAGEGGEFETLVVEGPCFKKKLIIEKGEVVMESENTGVYKIEKVKLF